jgi:hypothetical protein
MVTQLKEATPIVGIKFSEILKIALFRDNIIPEI